MDIKKQIDYWLKAAELDLQTAVNIFESDKNFHLCLYVSLKS